MKLSWLLLPNGLWRVSLGPFFMHVVDRPGVVQSFLQDVKAISPCIFGECITEVIQ
jgi:hypothetical protein